MRDWINQEFGADHALYYVRNLRTTQFGLFGGGSSSSSSATDLGQTAPGGQASGNQAVAGGSGSLNLGVQSRYLEQGSMDLMQANLANVGATQNSGNANIQGGVTSSTKDVSGTDLSGANLTGAGATTLGSGAKQVGGSDLTGASFNITDNGAVQAATDLAGRVVTSQSDAFNNALAAVTSGNTGALGSLGAILNASNNGNNAALSTLTDQFTKQQQTESQNLDTIGNTVTGVLGQLNSLQQSQASGAGGQLLSVIQYIALAVAAVLGLWLLFGKKAH